MAELRAFEPSWRDRLAGWMMGNERATPERRRMVEGLLGSSGLGNTGFGVVDATPVGGLLGAQEAAKEGDYRGAAMNAMFLGPAAKTANKVALKAAEEMAAKGATREAIWNETGWFKGADDKWRFEIDDSQARWGHFPGDPKRGMTPGELMLKKRSGISESLAHPELYAAYPDVGAIPLKPGYGMLPSYNGMYWSGENEKIALNPINTMGAGTREKSRSTTLHELQHAVQSREGFARGGNVEQFVDTMPDPQVINDAQVLAAFARRGIDPERAPAEFLNVLGRDPHPISRVLFYSTESEKLAQMPTTPYEAYRRLAGEVEARNVQARRDMTPDERRATPPWKTQEYPDELQIIRGLLGD